MKKVITYNPNNTPAMPSGMAGNGYAYDYSSGAGMLTLFES